MLWCFMDRDLDKLEDILTATADIADFIAGLDYASFVAERGRRYPILHAFTIIGEASSQLSTALRARHTSVPWQRIIDFRHRVVHGYDVLDLERTWQISVHFAPELRQQIQAVLAIEYPDVTDTSVK